MISVTSNGMIKHFGSVSSTNDIIKEMANGGAPEGSVVIADEQTNGRGRLGRSFMSPGGTGLYMSILLRPELSASDALLITTAAATAVAKAIEKHTGKATCIIWVNDVFLNGKKVCGILTEGKVSPDGTLEYAVLGIGVNLKEPKDGFGELSNIAGAIFEDEKVDRDTVANDILENFFGYYQSIETKPHYSDYIARDMIGGKNVTVYRAGEPLYDAKVLGISEDFSLVIDHDGKKENLASGEVSVRI